MNKKNKKIIVILLLFLITIFLVVSIFNFNFLYNNTFTKNYSIDLNIKSIIDNYNKNNKNLTFSEYLNKNKEDVENHKSKIENLVTEIEAKYNILAKDKKYLLSSSFSSNLTESEYKNLKQDKNIKRIYENEKIEIIKQSDNTLKESKEILEKINKETGVLKSNPKYSGQGTLIGIIDTGFDLEHPYFDYKVKNPKIKNNNYYLDKFDILKNGYQRYFISEKIPYSFDYIEETNKISASNKHGTHVAGIASGFSKDFQGVSYNSQLALFKIGNYEGNKIGYKNNSNISDIIIKTALEDALIIGCDVINMSLGIIGSIQLSSTYEEIFKKIEEAGIIVVCAGGGFGGIRNTGQNIIDSNKELIYNYSSKDYQDENTISSPASSNYVIAVGSIYKNKLKKAISSSHGVLENLDIKPDLVAPGIDIYSADAKNNGKIKLSGTSMAAPNVSGMIANYISYINQNKEKFSIFESKKEYSKFIKNIILSNSNPLIAKNNEEIDYILPIYQGNGFIDIEKVIASDIYFTVDKDVKNNLPKIKLEENKFNNNKFNFTFTINNISKEKKEFEISFFLGVPDYFEEDNRLTGFNKKIDLDYKITSNNNEIKNNKINVDFEKSNNSKIVTGFIDLSNNKTKKILQEYKNGTYISGYLKLKELNKNEVFTIPVIGYYNNGSSQKTFERNLMILDKDTDNNENTGVCSYFRVDDKIKELKYNYPTLYVENKDLGSFEYSYKNNIREIKEQLRLARKTLNEKQYNYIYDSRKHSSINKALFLDFIQYPVFRNINKINKLNILYNEGLQKNNIKTFEDSFDIPTKYAIDKFLKENINQHNNQSNYLRVLNDLVEKKEIKYDLSKFGNINNSYFDFYFEYILNDSFDELKNSKKIEKLRRIKIDNQKPIALEAKIKDNEFIILYDENDKLFKIDVEYKDNKIDTFFITDFNKISNISEIKLKNLKKEIKAFTLYDYAGNYQKHYFSNNKIDYKKSQISNEFLENTKILQIRNSDLNIINRNNLEINSVYYKTLDNNLYDKINDDNIETFIYENVKYLKLKYTKKLAALSLVEEQETIKLLEGTKIISKDFIKNKDKIKTIILPSTLEYLEDSSFVNTSIKTIVFKSEIAPTFIGKPFNKQKLKMIIPTISFGYSAKEYREIFDDYEQKNINIFISNQNEFIPNLMQDYDLEFNIEKYLTNLNEIELDKYYENLNNKIIKVENISSFNNKVYNVDFKSKKIENILLKNLNSNLETGDLLFIEEEKLYKLNDKKISGFLELSSKYKNLQEDQEYILATYFKSDNKNNENYKKEIKKFKTKEEEKNYTIKILKEIKDSYNNKKINVDFYKDIQFSKKFDENDLNSYEEKNKITKIYMKRDFKFFNLKIFNEKENKFESKIFDKEIEDRLSYNELLDLFKCYNITNIKLKVDVEYKKFIDLDTLFSYIYKNYNNNENKIELKFDINTLKRYLEYKIDDKLNCLVFTDSDKEIKIKNNKNQEVLYWKIDNAKVYDIKKYFIDNNINFLKAEPIFEETNNIDIKEKTKINKPLIYSLVSIIVLALLALIIIAIVKIKNKNKRKI